MPSLPVCFIGNSHIVSIKEAIESGSSPARGHVEFYYSPGLSLRDVVVENGVLVPTSDRTKGLIGDRNAVGQVVLADYSGFGVFGLRFSFLAALHVAARVSAWEPVSRGRQLVSRALFREMVREGLMSSVSLSLAGKIRAHCQTPIVICEQPLVLQSLESRRRLGEKAKRVLQLHKRALQTQRAQELRAEYKKAATEAADSIGADIIFQPEETVVDGVYTDIRYSRAERPDDDTHTNAVLGSMLAERVLETMEKRGYSPG